MALADDTSGQIYDPIFVIPPGGNPTIPPIAPDPDAPLGLVVIAVTNTLDDVGGSFRSSDRALGIYGGILIDPDAWFVDQFWIIPSPVNYANIFSDKTITVSILNTFRYEDKQLVSIDPAALADIDVSITAGPSTPADIRKFEQITFNFTASFDGVASFDDPVDFTFDDPT